MAVKTKDKPFAVRLSEDELDLFREAAERQDRRPATAAREVLVKWAKRVMAT